MITSKDYNMLWASRLMYLLGRPLCHRNFLYHTLTVHLNSNRAVA